MVRTRRLFVNLEDLTVQISMAVECLKNLPQPYITLPAAASGRAFPRFWVKTITKHYCTSAWGGTVRFLAALYIDLVEKFALRSVVRTNYVALLLAVGKIRTCPEIWEK